MSNNCRHPSYHPHTPLNTQPDPMAYNMEPSPKSMQGTMNSFNFNSIRSTPELPVSPDFALQASALPNSANRNVSFSVSMTRNPHCDFIHTVVPPADNFTNNFIFDFICCKMDRMLTMSFSSNRTATTYLPSRDVPCRRLPIIRWRPLSCIASYPFAQSPSCTRCKRHHLHQPGGAPAMRCSSVLLLKFKRILHQTLA